MHFKVWNMALFLSGFRMSGCECSWCWRANEWVEVKSGSGPSERVTGLDGGGFYQLCVCSLMFVKQGALCCLSVCFTALRCSSLAASSFHLALNASFFFFFSLQNKKGMGGSVGGGFGSYWKQPETYYWEISHFITYHQNSEQTLSLIQIMKINPKFQEHKKKV